MRVRQCGVGTQGGYFWLEESELWRSSVLGTCTAELRGFMYERPALWG